MNTKALPMNVRIRAVIDIRHRDLMSPLPKMESYAYRPKTVAERARLAQAKREEKEATKW